MELRGKTSIYRECKEMENSAEERMEQLGKLTPAPKEGAASLLMQCEAEECWQLQGNQWTGPEMPAARKAHCHCKLQKVVWILQ